MADPQAALEPSILKSILMRLGAHTGSYGEESYAEDVMQAINTHIVGLTQAGIGPQTGYRITSEKDLWADLLGDSTALEGAKDYIFIKCKLIFDPPTAAAITSWEELAKEALTRCNYTAEELTR